MEATESQPKGFKVFNIGHDEALTVDQSLSYICDELKSKPKLYTGGERGWVGDGPESIGLQDQRIGLALQTKFGQAARYRSLFADKFFV